MLGEGKLSRQNLDWNILFLIKGFREVDINEVHLLSCVKTFSKEVGEEDFGTRRKEEDKAVVHSWSRVSTF